MAIGTVSPTTWVLGTVAPPAWFQGVTDNVNGLIAGTGPTLKLLQVDGLGGNSTTIPSADIYASGRVYSGTLVSRGIQFVAAGGCQPFTVGNAVGGWTFGSNGSMSASGAGSLLSFPVAIPWAGVVGTSAQLNTVNVRVKTAGASALSVAVFKLSNLSSSSAISQSQLGTASSSGTGDQTVTVGSLTGNAFTDNGYYVTVTSGQTSDLVYAVELRWGATVF